MFQNQKSIVAIACFAAALTTAAGCGDSKKTTPSHDAGGGDASASGDAGPAVTDSGKPPALVKIDRSKLSDVGTTKPIDYADPNYWVCRPDMDPNECHRNLDATEIAADGTQKVVKHTRATDPKFDCFYVYPTVLLNGGAKMTDFSKIDIVLDPLLSQGAQFNGLCEVYAPLYRQNGLSTTGGGVGFSTGDGGTAAASADLGLNDVRAAFQYYMKHLNKGRNFVIIGHSQGTMVLTQMIKADLDDHPELRKNMISALLIGGGVNSADGKPTGGSFNNIPLCEKPAQTGCVVAYSSFAKEAPPDASALFGRASGGLKTACTDPNTLSGHKGSYSGSYLPTMSVNPTFGGGMIPAGVKTPFVLYRDYFKGECVVKDGASYLEISMTPAASDKRAVPPYRNASVEAIGFGLHLVDYNLPLDELIEMVRQQAAAMK